MDGQADNSDPSLKIIKSKKTAQNVILYQQTRIMTMVQNVPKFLIL
jgi:hypothetical protein